MAEIVKPTDEQIEEAQRIENNPAMIMALIDLLFMNEEQGKTIVS